MRQSVSDPKWWENLSPVTCNRFVTPCVALPLHLSPDLRRFPPNSGALEAVKLLHTSAAVHSPNLLIISLPVILHKAQGNAYVCFITNSLAAKKKKPQKTHRTYSIAERNATSKNVIKHRMEGDISTINVVREVCGKSKWKFKMAFAMKGEGVSRGSRVPHTYFEK